MLVTVVINAMKDSVEVLRSVAPAVQRTRQQASDAKEAKKLLGLTDPTGDAYRSDAVHPLYGEGKIHPDNVAALNAAAGDALLRRTQIQDEVQINPGTSSLLLFGSPTSEGLSRVAFDYEQVPEIEGLARRGAVLDLAYAWNLDPNKLGGGRVARYVPGKGVIDRPAWQIDDLRHTGASAYLRPEVDANGLITEDYLLVTRVRNFLSEEALARGQFLVSFGGAHGTGTRAVELLLKDRKLLADVLEQLKSSQARVTGLGGLPKAYQLLFRVSSIKHSPAGSIPRALELVDTVTLPDTDAVWDTAYRVALTRLERWYQEQP
ncbi:MAG TPA: hypothetical protein VFW38_03125 [Solirubrobacteraceae bacterium]|nr:hypothetical protein [Solirubrobacteraceae bacterium]